MNIPSNLLYHREHEWVRVEDDDVAVIGISDYAQGQLGDIVYLELPAVGDEIEDREEPFGQIESVKAMSDLFSPVTGTVIRVHEELIDTLTPINEDPYGEGWMIAVKMNDPSQLDELMTASEYERFLEEQG
jgi:glycine cleavage system H protein